MSTQKNLVDIRRAVAAAGGRIVDIKQGRHIKLTLDFSGVVRKLTVSVSPSDGHGLTNTKRDIHRLAAEAGNQEGRLEA